jgi:acyl-CoA synthetase (AMP-forming)/AMP-acid ligase II/thioesterase domain-containing protein/acyl carrier protein
MVVTGGTVSFQTQINESMGDIVRRHADATPDAPAIVAEGRRPLTYRELAQQSGRIRERLNSMGFGRGDRIAIVGPNDAAMAALITAVMGGATAMPMNPELSLAEFVVYLRDLNAQAIAIDSGLETAARTAAREIGLPVLEVERLAGDIAGTVDIRPGVSAGKAKQPEPAQADDLALVLMTSGTTANSKLIPITHRQLALKADRYARALAITGADRCLNLMPLFHGHGLQGTVYTALYTGGSFLMLPAFSVDNFFRLIATQAPTWYSGSYTFHHAIAQAASDHADDIKKSCLRVVRVGSGLLEAKIANELERQLGALVLSNYSCTEVSLICSAPLPPVPRKNGTVGRPLEGGMEVAIMGAGKQLLPPGERGEVVVRAADVFSGYENDPATNAECFVGEWYRTGDEGVFDADGYLTLTGRIKDIINRGGEKITPLEVDAAIKSHPDVADAMTFPIPHATLGEEVAAAVIPAPGAVFTDEVLSKYLRGRLAPFKVPRRFVIVDKFPMGPTGKIPRRGLADAFGLSIATAAARTERVEDDRPATPLEARLQRLWQETLRLDRVGLNEDFFMLGGDSLQAVELFLRIEKEFGRRLPRSVLFEAGTVAKMAELVEEFAPSPCLVPIQPKGNRPPFFCIHDANGEVLNYRELARLVGDAQPFYGIQCRGLDGEEEPFTNVADMAAHYVREIKKVQPVGPYYLGGYSFGGRVAYVMAQQLRAAGEEIALLALIDVYSQAGRVRVRLRDWFAHHQTRLKGLPVSRMPAYIWLRVSNFALMVYMTSRRKSYSAAWHFYKSRGRPLPRFLYRPVPANDMVRASYRARPYDGDAVLFKAERYAWTHADQHEGWHQLIKGRFEIRPISGRHFEIVNQPHVRTLAAELADALKKAQAKSSGLSRFPAKAS